MANDDRINDLYRGEIMGEDTQRRTRARIDWLVSQAQGRVLDLGCSQGIGSILCARNGHEVVGVDVQKDRIEHARAELANEPAEVRERASFQVADGSSLDFGDAAFDSILLGEVIEHIADPAPLLKEMTRVLKPNGVIALTTPFGLSPHPDHEATFYPAGLMALLAPLVAATKLEVADRFIRVTAGPGTTTDAERVRLVFDAQPSMEAAVKEIEEKGLETWGMVQHARGRVERLRKQLDNRGRRGRRFPRNLLRGSD